MILQVLKKDVKGQYEMAEKYYGLLSVVNDLGLTPREIQLVSFTAIKGNITNFNVKDEFCKKYKTTVPTINNIVSKLKKQYIFLKEEGKVFVNPLIVIDFKKDIKLDINLYGKTTEHVAEGMVDKKNDDSIGDTRENN